MEGGKGAGRICANNDETDSNGDTATANRVSARVRRPQGMLEKTNHDPTTIRPITNKMESSKKPFIDNNNVSIIHVYTRSSPSKRTPKEIRPLCDSGCSVTII